MRQPKPWYRQQTGTWYVEINGKQVRLGKDETEAWREYHRLMDGASLSSGTPVVHLLDEFLDWVQKNQSEGTYKWYRHHLRRFRRRIGDRLRVEDLKPYHLTRWIDGLNGGQTTKHHAGRTVKRAFNWAVREGYIQRSPVAGATIPGQARRERILSADEWKTILAAVPDQQFRDFLTLLKETGCRPTEARIVEARHLQGDRWIFDRDESKGQQDRRVVYLTDRAQAICKRLAEKHPTGPLLRNRRGNPWSKDTVVLRFRRLRKRLEMDGVSAYTIRHTWATEALERGVDPITVATLMGHRDATMVARTYQHLAQRTGHLKAALRRATGVLETGPTHPATEGRPA